MPSRCKKSRKCGCQLKVKAYKPTGTPMKDIEKNVLYKDELESLKLCDMNGLNPGGGRIKNGDIEGNGTEDPFWCAEKSCHGALSKCMAW